MARPRGYACWLTPPRGAGLQDADRRYESTCAGTREGDVCVDIRTTYTYRMPKEQADRNTVELRKLAAEVEALDRMPPGVAKERQGWIDKYS